MIEIQRLGHLVRTLPGGDAGAYDEIGIRSLATYVDPASRAMGSPGLVGIPTTVLIDRHGREIGRRTGPAQWDGLEAVRMFESYLHEAKP